jgi:hypothetical protein
MDNTYANEPSKANAERVAATVKGQHPVFQEIRVVEDENSFDYQYRTPQVQTPVKLETAPTGERVQRMAKNDKHHIATNKNNKSTARGGPWTPKFKVFFENAGLDINKASQNLVDVTDHYGPHPEEYHQYIYDELFTATQGLIPKTN